MSDVTKRGELHYTYWSPCINKRRGVASTLWTPNLCFDSPNCLRDTDEFVKQIKLSGQAPAFSPKKIEVIGLARDGHLMIGPYQGVRNEIWTCETHDICNGAFMDNGSYVYVATSTYPYLVGCWGPGP